MTLRQNYIGIWHFHFFFSQGFFWTRKMRNLSLNQKEQLFSSRSPSRMNISLSNALNYELSLLLDLSKLTNTAVNKISSKQSLQRARRQICYLAGKKDGSDESRQLDCSGANDKSLRISADQLQSQVHDRVRQQSLNLANWMHFFQECWRRRRL